MSEQEKIYVTPGAGRKAPLPLPGGGAVPGVGCYVAPSIAVTRLLNSGDLVVADAPAGDPVTMKTQRYAPQVAKAAEAVEPAPAAPVPAPAKGEK